VSWARQWSCVRSPCRVDGGSPGCSSRRRWHEWLDVVVTLSCTNPIETENTDRIPIIPERNEGEGEWSGDYGDLRTAGRGTRSSRRSLWNVMVVNDEDALARDGAWFRRGVRMGVRHDPDRSQFWNLEGLSEERAGSRTQQQSSEAL
jgi:hypothetical protein